MRAGQSARRGFRNDDGIAEERARRSAMRRLKRDHRCIRMA